MGTRVSANSQTSATDIATGIGIDLGRHRSYAGGAGHSVSEPYQLSSQHSGLLIRWVGESGAQRLTERILDLAGIDQDEAVGFVGLVAQQILGSLPDPETPATSHQITNIAIPASFGPQCRRAVIEGFRRSGLDITSENLVERPIAALAGWLAHREQISGGSQREPVLLVDNDGGELSAVIADPLSKRILSCMPLSTGPSDDSELVTNRLKELITKAATMLDRQGILRSTDWPTISATLPRVVVTGSGQAHPAIQALIQSLLPAADLVPDPLVTDPAHCVVLGIQHLHRFSSWHACWPTSDICIVDANEKKSIIIQQGQILGREDESYVVSPSARLEFGTADSPLRLRSGSIRATGLVVPPSIGPFPVLKLLMDGRMHILGTKGKRPLALHLGWPVPGLARQELRITTVGRRAATLV